MFAWLGLERTNYKVLLNTWESGNKIKAAYTTALKRHPTGYVRWVAKLEPHVVIGRNIHRLRNERGMTQEVLAEKAAIDRRSLQRIEAGQWNMTVDYVERLREALGCTWVELVDRL